MKKLLTLSLINILFALLSMAQSKVDSPVINPDNSVTFNLYMPDADKVVLKGSFIPSKEYIKTEMGTLIKAAKLR